MGDFFLDISLTFSFKKKELNLITFRKITKNYGKPYGTPGIRFYITNCFHPGHPMLHPGHVHPGRIGPPGSMSTLYPEHVQHGHPT